MNFAYPFGAVSPAAKRHLVGRFMSCRGVVAGIHAGQVDLGCLRAVQLYDSRVDKIRVDRYLEQVVRRNAWVIFYTHDVMHSPTLYGCSPDLLEYAVDRAKALGIDILTVRDAIGAAIPSQMR
jgi:hypothetical protein